MTSEPTNPNDESSKNGSPEILTSIDRAVDNYVQQELKSAAQTLKWTRVVSLVLVLGALVETAVVAGGFNNALQPKQAATVADGIIAQRVEDNSDNIKAAIEQKTPQLIDQIPDQAIQQLPGFRQSIESNFDASLNGYATSTSQQLDLQLSDYLSAHKDQVGAALAGGKDDAAVHELATGLTQGFIASLKDTEAGGGETAGSKFDQSLASLTEIKQKLDRLAANKGLSPEEKNTRRSIAILAQTVSKQAAPLNISRTIADSQANVSSN